VDVRGAAFKDGALLFVKEIMDGKWSLPGGWADINESPATAIVREIQEEAGYDTRCTKLVAVYDRSMHPHDPPHPFHVYKLFFQCEIVGEIKRSDRETEAVGFFPEDALPELSLARVTPDEIARLFHHYRHPELPTDFE
jgi:ADP-ribose pyrophosphatase YjhB (NUDIX family)